MSTQTCPDLQESLLTARAAYFSHVISKNQNKKMSDCQINSSKLSNNRFFIAFKSVKFSENGVCSCTYFVINVINEQC